MPALGYAQLLESLNNEVPSQRLVVTPLLNQEQVGPSSIDVRLGNEFVVLQRARFSALTLSDHEHSDALLRQYSHKTRIDYGEDFVLHPGQLILGSTLEYLSLPLNLMAYVIGRSSWGRMGLIIATATEVDPGFKGVLTLELVNMGDIPVVVRPGVRIAQLVFHRCEGATSYHGRFKCPTGPESSKIMRDKDFYAFRGR